MVWGLLILVIGIPYILLKLVPEQHASNQHDRTMNRLKAEDNAAEERRKKYADDDRLRQLIAMESANRYDELYDMAKPAIEEVKEFGKTVLWSGNKLFQTYCHNLILGMDHKISSTDAYSGFDFFRFRSEENIEAAFHMMQWLNKKMKEVGMEEMVFVPLKYGFNVEVYIGPPVRVSSMQSPQYGIYYWDSLVSPYTKARIQNNPNSYLLK